MNKKETIAGYLRASKIVINEIRMRHWLGKWQAHTQRERAKESYSVSAENARERVRATETATSEAAVNDVARAFPTRLKTRAYRFYFVVCFSVWFSFSF